MSLIGPAPAVTHERAGGRYSQGLGHIEALDGDYTAPITNGTARGRAINRLQKLIKIENRGFDRMTDNNGFANYETWLTSLWLNNTAEYYRAMLGALEELQAKTTDPGELLGQFAEALKNLTSEIVEEERKKVKGMCSDYLGHFVSIVDFFEIAKDFIEDHNPRPFRVMLQL